jgi:predicted glycoside hydrolase/deacetylase ChbG (UPF0249 family)
LNRLLIVNADDYGLTPAVSRGILRAHREGIVTSASILALAPGFSEAAAWLPETSSLGVGIHLAAVGEDPPLSPPAKIRSLVDRAGRLPASWKHFLLRALSGRIRPAELEVEFALQIGRVLGLGVRVTHLDTHQHLHLWPPVRETVIRLARRFGIRAIRVPRSSARRIAGPAMTLLAARLEKRARQEGLVFPAATAGFEQSGRMGKARLALAIDRLGRSQAGSAEIIVHPGEAHDPDRARYAWGYRWEEELEALVDGEARAHVERAGLRLGTFADLARDRE